MLNGAVPVRSRRPAADPPARGRRRPRSGYARPGEPIAGPADPEQVSTTTNTAVVAMHDLLIVDVPATGRVLVTSDLHLPAATTPAATWVGRELATVLDSWIGPGVLVLGGDALELLGTGSSEPRQILSIHSRWAAAVRRFAEGEERRVVGTAGAPPAPAA